MKSYISKLYKSDLMLEENSHAASLMESFEQERKWLMPHLSGEKELEWLNDLSDINRRLIDSIGIQSFREGFIIGANLVMEACYGHGNADDD